jgi:hypothetical protein
MRPAIVCLHACFAQPLALVDDAREAHNHGLPCVRLSIGAERRVPFGVVRLHRADGSFHVHLPRFEGAEEVACGLERRVGEQCALLGEVQLRVQVAQRRRQFG